MMRAVLLALLAVLTVAPPLQAQRRTSSQGVDADARGAPSLSLEVGEGVGTFLGLWGRVAAPVSLGVEVELGFTQEEVGEDEERTTTTALGAGGSVKWFLTPGSALTPFIYAHVGVTSREREREGEGFDEEATLLLARGALGLEWFASRSFSVAGNVGARWRSGEVESPAGAGRRTEVDHSLLEVFTTGISVAFHL